ncbi:hypothetical protein TWF481_008790 [Arthrobotrys musiformis]|uniref:Uncharacterized protein n=1 Tax=Arthrobotrys musiformis TaxID=47236 RepID=A0AAV9WA70_9PEZI
MLRYLRMLPDWGQTMVVFLITYEHKNHLQEARKAGKDATMLPGHYKIIHTPSTAVPLKDWDINVEFETAFRKVKYVWPAAGAPSKDTNKSADLETAKDAEL